MISASEFLELTSAKANHDSKLRGNVLAYIDDNFDPSTYPQVKPRVMIPGQSLSDKGFPCASSYKPVPGDRVLLAPAGTSDYVIVCGLGTGNDTFLFPGQRVFIIDNHNAGQNQGAGSGSYIQWSNSMEAVHFSAGNDPYGFWNSSAVTEVRPTIGGYYTLVGKIQYPSATSTISSDRRMSIHFNGANQVRGGNYFVNSISGSIVSLSFTYPGLYFNGSGDYIRLLCGGSVGGGTAYPSGANASFLSMYYDGPGQAGDPLPVIET